MKICIRITICQQTYPTPTEHWCHPYWVLRLASVPPLLSTSVHPLRDSENAYVSIFSYKNAQFLKNTTLRISSVWRPESPAIWSWYHPYWVPRLTSFRPENMYTYQHFSAKMLNTNRTLVPPLLSTSVGFGTTLIEYFGSPPSGLRKCIHISIFKQKCSVSEKHNS